MASVDTKPRKAARLAGATVFASPVACDACNTVARYVSNGGCVECAKRNNRKRLANPKIAKAERVKTRQRVAEYRARKKAEKAAAQGAEFGDILG